MKKLADVLAVAAFTTLSLASTAASGRAQASPPTPQTPPSAVPDPAANEPRGLRSRAAGAFEGYTLLAPLNSKSIYLVDMDGKVVHTWETQDRPGGVTTFLDNGHVLRSGMKEENPRFHGGGLGGRIVELDWDNKVVWEFELASAERTLHHDLCVMPNGNLLAIAWEYHPREDVFERGRSMDFLHEEGLWTDVVLEIKPRRPSGGDIVWTWRTWDHLVQDLEEAAVGYGRLQEHAGKIDINADHRYLPKTETEEEKKKREEREREMRAVGYTGGDDPPKPPADNGPKIGADWLHTNAIDYLPGEDLIVLSVPHLCEIWVIDHSATSAEAAGASGGRRKHGGEILYRWGNPQNYGVGAESDRRLFYQHNATWQPGAKPGELRVLVYNNGSRRPGKEYSSVEELILPYDPTRGFTRDAARPFGPAAPAWSYSEPERFFSAFISGAQRLSNGNTLICEGAKGRVFEITPAGEVVWDFWSPLGGELEPSKQGGKAPPKALFRAMRIAKNHPGLAGRF
jgi:hypothetical protein